MHWMSLCPSGRSGQSSSPLRRRSGDYDAAGRRPYPGGLFKSGDGGQNWQKVLAARLCKPSPSIRMTTPIVYAGTDDHPYHDRPLAQGVLRSSDGGVTWRRENTGLTHLNIGCLGVSPYDPRMILLGTAGNGAFLGQEIGR